LKRTLGFVNKATKIMKTKNRMFDQIRLINIVFIFVFAALSIAAQTTAFTYQGKLSDAGFPANANYDMRFGLFDAIGNQVGTSQTVTNVPAAGGIFSVQLDFGAPALSGADRFLEVSISRAGQNNFTTLTPRQQLTSAPYSIQAVNSLSLGGTAANQFVQTSDSRLSDARVPLPGSNDYLQNTTAQQPSVNFNIGGSGVAAILDASVQFNIAGSRILSNAGTDNLFAGVGAGVANTTGPRNAFFGRNAGNANINGNDNAFFGFNAGLKSRSFANAFFGSGAGQENANGNSLSFFGTNAGNKNVTGVNDSFFGNAAGRENTTGASNTFLGFAAGLNNTTGNNNIFIGSLTGNPDQATQINNSIGIGNNVSVPTSNTILLGTTAHTTQIPGKLMMGGGVPLPGSFVAQSFSNLGFSGLFTGNVVLDENALNNVLPSQVSLCIRTTNIGNGFGGEMLARCTAAFAPTTGKTDVQPFTGGLDVVKRLRPVSFKWKADGTSGIGLNADEVAEIAPALISRNAKGEIEDVKENGVIVILIDALKQQQSQIEAQQKRIALLMKLACETNPGSAACKEDQK
jgi:hypothetical protein